MADLLQDRIDEMLVPLRAGMVMRPLPITSTSVPGQAWYRLLDPDEPPSLDKQVLSSYVQTTRELQLVPFTPTGSMSTPLVRTCDGKSIDPDVIVAMQAEWMVRHTSSNNGNNATASSPCTPTGAVTTTLLATLMATNDTHADGATDGVLVFLFHANKDVHAAATSTSTTTMVPLL